MSGFSGRDLACIRGERVIFDQLDFALSPGEVLLVRGPNGSGKSSLLRLMAGFLRPAAGDLLWDDSAIASDWDAHRTRVTYVGHLDAVKLPLTAAENVTFWGRLVHQGGLGDGHGGRHTAARTEQALARLDISHLADIPAGLMSAGQRRRVNLARLVVAPTPLWLLDEPTTSLDSAGVEAVEDLIADHLGAGGIVVAATHQAMLRRKSKELVMSGETRVAEPLHEGIA